MSYNEVTIAATNFAVPPFDIVRWGVDDYAEFVTEAGYDGLEYMPTRGFGQLEHQLQKGHAGGNELVTSFHQSFRGETAKDIATYALSDVAELVRVAPAFGLMPRSDSSMPQLAAIQRKMAEPKSAVVFPNFSLQKLPPVAFSADPRPFSDLLIQPTTEIANKWDVTRTTAEQSVTALRRHILARHFNVCLDFQHWNRPSTLAQSLPDWQVAFPAFASDGMIKEAHIGPNRSDLEPGTEQNQLDVILAGKLGGLLLGDQIQAVKEHMPNRHFPYTVIEMTAGQIATAGGPKNLTAVHKDLVAAIRQFIEAA